MKTSVTEFIKIDEVRKEIDFRYPNPGKDVTNEIRVTNNGYSHKLIGRTFEFLFKLWLYHQSEEVICPAIHSNINITDDGDEEGWSRGARYDKIPHVSVTVFDGMKFEDREHGPSNMNEWEEMNQDRPSWKQENPTKWVEDEDLSKVVNQYVETGMNTERVVRAALLNAGWKPRNEVDTWIERDAFEDDILSEMGEMFRLLQGQDWAKDATVFDKPKFGNYRYILPAEGDFIVDDLLVDIKTTERREFTKSFWRQLLSYYILNDVQRELYDTEVATKEQFEDKYPEINRVGIYFARFGELQTVTIDEIIDDTEEFETFRAWFINRAIEENRNPQINYSTVRETLTEKYNFRQQQSLSDF